MANYDLTYEGSRVQNILDTGDELRDAGYIFRGEATPSTVPGTPTERVAYIGGPGTYSNFGTSTEISAGCIGVFKYNGSAWSIQVINTGLSAAITTEAESRANADGLLQNAISAINAQIGNGYVYAGVATPSTEPVSGKVFYLAITAGTYTNFEDSEETPLAVTAGINVLKNTGTGWVLDQVIAIDAEPTPGSDNPVNSNGVFNSIIQNGPAFDLTAYTGGTTYANLEAALAAMNDLPAMYKKGGMQMKYVCTSDNKYVQYRLKSQNFNTTTKNWQGVDTEPTLDSPNLVESGGVEKNESIIAGDVFGLRSAHSYSGWPDSDNVITLSSKGKYKVVRVNGGEKCVVNGVAYLMILASFTYDPVLPYTPNYATGETGRRKLTNTSIVLPEDAKYLIIGANNTSGEDVLPTDISLDGLSLYTPTKNTVIENRNEISILHKIAEVNDFQGKKLSIIGDSISTFDKSGYKIDGYEMYYPYGDVDDVNKTYWKKLMDASGMQLEVNASYSGSCITNVMQQSGYPDFYDRVELLGNPDVIIVELGLNDYRQGSLAGVTYNIIDFDKEQLSESDFTEGYIKGIKGLISNYPSAKIYCLSMIPHNSYGELRPEAIIIKTIAEHYECVFIDCSGYDTTGMTTVHPNAFGMNYIAKKISDNLVINKLLSISQKQQDYDKFIKSYTPTFVQGGIGSGGSLNSRNDRIRTESFIPAELVDYIKIDDKHNYCFALAFYDSNKQFKSIQSTYNRFADGSSSFPSGTAYIKAVVSVNGGNYKNGGDSSTQILPTDDTGFAISCLRSSEFMEAKSVNNTERIGSLKTEVDRISQFNYLSETTESNGYIDKDGVFHSSSNWTTYSFEKKDKLTRFKLKVWNSLTGNYKLYKSVSFYTENGTYNGGYDFNDIPSGTEAIIDNIPEGTFTISISNRNEDGTPELFVFIDFVISSINQQVDVEHYDSLGNAEFWLNGINRAYSDMTWVGNKLICFTGSSDDLETTEGRVIIYAYDNGIKGECSAQYTLLHYWGHCNTVDYNASNDCLILGNGSGSYTLAGKIFIIPNFSSIVNVSDDNNTPMSLSDVDALIIDCASYNLGSKFNLVWGDDNDKNYNIAYLITSNYGSSLVNEGDLETIRKIVLRKGAETGNYGSVVENLTPFNGTFDIVETYKQKTDGYANCDQGTCYYNGEVLAAIGHDGAWLWKMRMHDDKIYRKDYKQISYHAAGSANLGNSSGICIKEGYLFFGRSGLGIMALNL